MNPEHPADAVDQALEIAREAWSTVGLHYFPHHRPSGAEGRVDLVVETHSIEDPECRGCRGVITDGKVAHFHALFADMCDADHYIDMCNDSGHSFALGILETFTIHWDELPSWLLTYVWREY